MNRKTLSAGFSEAETGRLVRSFPLPIARRIDRLEPRRHHAGDIWR